MNEPKPHRAEEPSRELQAPVAKLEESLRELIRQELGHPPPLRPTPSGVEALWLFLCIANAALILLLLPDALLKSVKWRTLSNIIMWLSGSLFVLGSVWFRELFLELSRGRLRFLQLALLALLLPLYISQTPVFKIYPEIEPADVAEVEYEGQVESGWVNGLWVPLKPHTFTVRRKPRADAGIDPGVDPDKDPNKAWKERKIDVSRFDLLRIWWRGPEEKPHWPLLFPTAFYAAKPVGEVIVWRRGGEFDPAYLKEPAPLQPDNPQQDAALQSDTRDGSPVLVYRWPFKDKAGYLNQWHPLGKYEISARADGCDEATAQEFEVTTKIQRVELLIPCATRK